MAVLIAPLAPRGSRFVAAYFVVVRRRKSVSAHSSSARRRAIRQTTRSVRPRDPSDQLMLVRVRRGGGSAVDVDLGENIAEVPSNSLLAEEQGRRDTSIGLPMRY
jgi:hypothetical protein